MPDRKQEFEYDVCLSFAGEDRGYVDEVASGLRNRGVRVFYDDYEKVKLWGKDLYEHLDFIYRSAARYCVLFVSEHYRRKVWTNHERRSAQARALEENREYVLPARFDETEIPGLPATIGHVDLGDMNAEELVEAIVDKLGPRQLTNFFPPEPDRLYEVFDAEDEDMEMIEGHAWNFFKALQRMSVEERRLVTKLLADGCPAELPENVHMSLDLLRRDTGYPSSQITEILGGIHALGFKCELRDWDPCDPGELRGDDKVVVLEWANLSEGADDGGTLVAREMLRLIREYYCDEHAAVTLDNLDFSQLASATAAQHVH